MSSIRVAISHEAFGGPAPIFDGTDWQPGRADVLGVRIVDHDGGGSYVVTLDDHNTANPALTSAWRAPIRGAFAHVTWISDAELVALAAAYLRRREAWQQGLSADESRAVSAGWHDLELTELIRQSGRPPLSVVASDVRLALQAGRSLEWVAANLWHVSYMTARRWATAARETTGPDGVSLLPELTGRRGRPRKTSTTKES
ncbi:hypothetical protein Q9R20_12370 [Microbacterium sp. PRF11]|uniref:hypothetical protein n=1 Tax=Microbacterium sp. PRF11 TaxID=2962593 RepID=UPI00288162FF|nr:hypothetical protein [Microbacterium sp. PRF11]MDT0117781.1 hypothetical protein [Microbacterium sp. PRF11]